MAEDDDPEARIRELERSLTDEARASETGAQPYAEPLTPQTTPYVSPTAPPTSPFGASYGAPFPMTTARTSTGFGKYWLLLSLFVFGILVVAGGIAFFAVHQFSNVASISGSPGSPTVSVGGSVADRPNNRPSGEPAEPTSVTETPPPGSKFSISGVAQDKFIVCNDADITIGGVNNTVVITGHCSNITVSGSHNVVTVDSVDAVSASGVGNKLTYHSGSPEISNAGSGNVVEQG